MSHTLVNGLALVDATGRIILSTTIGCLLLAIVANLMVRDRYRRLERDLARGQGPYAHGLFNRIADDVLEAAQRTKSVNTQAIIEERFHAQLRLPLLAERFVKAATGLVIILGLLGTFYGLTLSIGRIVGLVSADTATADVAGSVTTGLTHALSGMAVAFSNSLAGIASAVILTILGVFSNLTDRRVGLMLQLETQLDRVLATTTPAADDAAPFGEAVARLDDVVTRFEAALAMFAASTKGFNDFNAHLKDNIQRMSLSFGDFSDTLRGQIGAIGAIKARDGR